METLHLNGISLLENKILHCSVLHLVCLIQMCEAILQKEEHMEVAITKVLVLRVDNY
jgi:hypothetical protein